MPALPPVPGVAKLKIAWTAATRAFSDGFFVKNATGGSWTAGDLLSLATQVFNHVSGRMLPFVDSAVSLDHVEATDLSSAMGLSQRFGSTLPGTNPGTQCLPISNVVRTTFQTPLRYRGGRPGINLSGGDRTNTQSLIEWATVYALNVGGAWGLLLQTDVPTIPLSTGAAQWVIVSYHAGHAVRPVPLVLVPLGLETQLRICTLRKRLGKGIAG